MIRIFFIFFLITSLFLTPNTAFAAPAAPCNAAVPGDCPAGLDQLEKMVGYVISSVVGLGFIALFVMLIVAGVKYLTSGGDQKAVASAHQTATWAIMGVLLLAVSWITLQLVAVFTGIDTLTTFNPRVLCKIGGVGFDWCNKP